MSGSEDIVGALREYASIERGHAAAQRSSKHSDGAYYDERAVNLESAADLIDRLTTEKAEWREQALDKGTLVGRLIPENARLSEQVEKQGKVVELARGYIDLEDEESRKNYTNSRGPTEAARRYAQLMTELRAALNGLVEDS